jgi:hypothetical protein
VTVDDIVKGIVLLVIAGYALYFILRNMYVGYLIKKRGYSFCNTCKWSDLSEVYCFHPRETKKGYSTTFCDIKNSINECTDWEDGL